MDLELILFLSKSVAIRLLEENLRLLIYPDPVKGSPFKIWFIAHPRKSPLAVEYVVE
jgi:hypothetical protein